MLTTIPEHLFLIIIPYIIVIINISSGDGITSNVTPSDSYYNSKNYIKMH